MVDTLMGALRLQLALKWYKLTIGYCGWHCYRGQFGWYFNVAKQLALISGTVSGTVMATL